MTSWLPSFEGLSCFLGVDNIIQTASTIVGSHSAGFHNSGKYIILAGHLFT